MWPNTYKPLSGTRALKQQQQDKNDNLIIIPLFPCRQLSIFRLPLSQRLGRCTPRPPAGACQSGYPSGNLFNLRDVWYEYISSPPTPRSLPTRLGPVALFYRMRWLGPEWSAIGLNVLWAWYSDCDGSPLSGFWM